MREYITKPASRADIRKYASLLRDLFSIPPTGPFPVLDVLERLDTVFDNSNYLVVKDEDFPQKTMARCFANDIGGYTIEIRQSVYDGAYECKVGAFLGFICHEICHVFLFTIGFTPIYEKSLERGETPAYCSVEWQAKSLCGEVMIPFEESKGMSVTQICRTYHCSKAFAKYRKELGRGESN